MTEEQPIDIHQYTRAIRHAFPQILVLAVIAAALAAVTSFYLASKGYVASATILARGTLGSTQFTDATTVSRSLATVNLLTRTTDVLSLAARRLPDTTVDELRATVHSSIDSQANVITINATADTADAAAARANRVAAALVATERRIERQAATDAIDQAVAQVAELRAAGATNIEINAAENRLATLPASALGSAGGFQIIQHAETPGRASSPPPWLSGVVAFLAMGLLGMLFVLAREQVSPRLSSTRDLDELFSMPVLAAIPLVRRLGGRGQLFVPRAARDAFHVLASSVRRDAKRHGTKVLIVTSALRGEGRTTVAAGLARALSAGGASVLAVSGDLRRPTLHKWLDVPRSPGLTDVLFAARDSSEVLESFANVASSALSAALESAVHPAEPSTTGTLAVLSAGSGVDDPAELLFGDAFPLVFKALRALPYDFVVVDGPPGLGAPDLQPLASHADALLVVVRTDRLRTSQAAELRDRLDTLAIERLGLVVIDREPHPVTYPTGDEVNVAHAQGATGQREVVELR